MPRVIQRLASRVPPELRRRWRRVIAWVRLKVPAGFRLPVGVLLICGGFLAILPVFGLWMIPVGIAVAALDLRPLRRRWSARKAGFARPGPSPIPTDLPTWDDTLGEDAMRKIEGRIEGDLTIRDAAWIAGSVDGALEVRPGAKVHLAGAVGGDAVVRAGGFLRVAGQVAGEVVCESGARAVICGMAGRADPSSPGITVDGGLVAHPGAAAA